MRKATSLRKSKLMWGLALLAAGLLIIIVGLVLPRLVDISAFNPRLIPAAGVVLVGVGIAYLGQYATIRLDPEAGRQLLIQATDERFRLIRARAGSRAFWVSIVMTYIILLWVALAASGNIPALSDNTLTFILAAAVIVPMVVYVVGFIYEQINK